MSLNAHEQHVLAAIEDRLARSDPALASELALFTRLGAGKAVPARERIRSGGHACRQPAWPLLWFAICIALISAALVTSHYGGNGGCAG